MNTRDEIFSGTKEIDQKLDFDHSSLNNYLKKAIGSNTNCITCTPIASRHFCKSFSIFF